MKKLVIWATAALFALSLQGAALAQKEEKAPESMPPAMESPSPLAPAEKAPAPENSEDQPEENQKEAQNQKDL